MEMRNDIEKALLIFTEDNLTWALKHPTDKTTDPAYVIIDCMTAAVYHRFREEVLNDDENGVAGSLKGWARTTARVKNMAIGFDNFGKQELPNYNEL